MKESNKISAKIKYSGKKSYRIAAVAIFVIIVSHFLFQFIFIQSENIRGVEELVKTEQFEPNKTISVTENLPELSEPQIKNAETETIEDSKDEPLPDEKIQPEPKKSTKVVKKPQLKSSAVKPKTKNIRPPKTVTKNVPQPETRAERLRRAEKLLTGV